MLIKDAKHYPLGTRDRALVKLINENPDYFIDITITEFAKRAQTSASVISKFIRRLHFSNYREFQSHLARERLALENVNSITLDQKALVIDEASLKLKNYDYYFLNQTVNNLDYRSFVNIVDELEGAKRIWIIGEGNSRLAALDLTNSLIQLGKMAFCAREFKDLLAQVNYLSSHDLVMFIADSWRLDHYYEIAESLRNKKVTTAMITGRNQNLIPFTDLVLTFYAPSNLKKRPPFYNSKIQELFINNLLMQAIARRIKFE